MRDYIILKYENYLNENKLVDIFQQLSNYVPINLKTQVKIGKRFKGDITINDKYLIEFDGYMHYTEASTCMRDIKKDKIWENTSKDNKVIRIPYFVQLDNYTFYEYFEDILKDIGIKYGALKIQSNYPHGFIDKNALLPANFCSIGLLKFCNDLNKVFYVRDDIIQSLVDWIETKDIIEVLPLNLSYNEFYKKLIPIMRRFYTEIDFDIYDSLFNEKPLN